MRGLIAFAGAPGVGKTTTALALRQRFRDARMPCGYAPEFARDLIARYGYPEHAALQLHAAFQQRELERVALRTFGRAVTDTTTWFCHLFPMLFNSGTAGEQERKVINDLGAVAEEMYQHYTHTFYLPLRDDIEDDGIRDPHASPYIDEQMRFYIDEHREAMGAITFVPEGLGVDEVVEFALRTLDVELTPDPLVRHPYAHGRT